MATSQAGPVRARPGKTDGVCSEFTIFTQIKPGHADALRAVFEEMAAAGKGNRAAVREIGTLHVARHVIYDNDTRLMFASVFDGSWDDYIDDFLTTVAKTNFDTIFSHTEGFPGITDPRVKDWFVSQQEPAEWFITAYPDLTVQQIWKDQRVSEAFQDVIDTPEFRALLNDPASTALQATPAFQKLLDEASG